MGENKKNKKLYFYSFIITVLAICVLVLYGLLVNMSHTAESLATSLIDRTTEDANNNFDNYFNRLRGNLLTTKQLGDQGIVDASKNEKNEAYWLPIINTYPEINTIAIIHPNGHECSLIKEDSTWLSSVVNETLDSGMVIERTRWEGNLFRKDIVEEWNDYNSTYDPRTRPWFSGAMNNKFPEEPWWTDPYVFFTVQKPGITATIKSYCPITQDTNIIFYDILLSEISDFTINERASENGKTFVMTKDLKVIGLPNEPHLSSPDSISKYVLKDYDSIGSEVVEKIVSAWKKSPNNNDKAFNLLINGEKWWVKISPFQLGKNKEFWVCVAVPENDFLSEVNSTKNVVVGGFIIVLLIILIVVRQYMLKQKVNQTLSIQKEEISRQRDEIGEQHQEIKDSMEYAKRIQSAILPPKTMVKEYLKNSFILYKPKDIVAGDFYWMEHANGKTLFAAADCTGHGVPGAMVSVICNGALNRSVREFGLTDPGKILGKARDIVIGEFEKSEEDVKDGMDIALCSLEGKLLKYAGAHNPLWIIRPSADSGTKEIIETKADKQPIGKFDNPHPYTTHTFELEKNDTIYIFSDGFVDQFGGPKGKKFKAKAFRELLIGIQDKPMEEQKRLIDEAFEKWRGSLEQIDDVCVIGVRV